MRIVALCFALACARDLSVPAPSARPVLTSYSPTSAYENAVLTIVGKNFDPVAANNTVQFTAKSARAFDFDAQHNLLVSVPGRTYNDLIGKISVSNSAGLSDPSAVDFNYLGHGRTLDEYPRA